MKQSSKKFTLLLLVLLFCLFCSMLCTAAPVDMRYIPAGYAMMGAEYGDLTAKSNAKP